MLLAAESSGPHATGFVAATEPLKRPFAGRVISSKQPLKAERFVAKEAAWRRLAHQRCSAVVGHVRWATHGNPDDNRNNHPFVSRDGRYHMVHNGVLANHEDVDERYQLRRSGDCDSESLLRLVEKVGDARNGIATCINQFQGTMAVVLLDARTGLVWAATNGGRPLWVCRLRDQRGWLLASTDRILKGGLKATYGERYERRLEVLMPLAANAVHALSSGGELLTPGVTRSFEQRVLPFDEA